MPYDCVIATKNRVNALKMSIPLILKQEILPGRLIIVDASDDHDSVKAEIGQISEQFRFKNAIVVKSDAPNSARQRNVGLQLVEAPIVMFPDDDSMWHRGFASNVLKIYDADVRRQVGGVSGLGVQAAPPELEQPAYKKGAFASLKSAVQPYRNEIENRLFPHPFGLIGLATWTDDVDVVDGINSKRIPHITGFRMSFRTDAMREVGFDETLGYGAGYAYHEDLDASLRLERLGYALVSAENARVCHYSFPGRRGKGYDYGFISIANCVYICRKTIGPDVKIYSVLERYLKYKLSLYASRLYSGHAREVFQGAFDAWRNRSRLLQANEAGLSDAYKALFDQYIKK
ncbi:MAG TPA: glycosyltransferase [Roseiarcus sp.]|jgi:glycosyltransferase involved in cell wall biosynthesis|nr:glycosyltransferase [Roseiarcus sp.]